MNSRRSESQPSLGDLTSRRENGDALSVYRKRTARIILVLLHIFGLACLQVGSQFHVASLLSVARLNPLLAFVWAAFTGFSVVYVSLLFWEAARFHVLHRTRANGLQFAYGLVCGLIGWLLPPPTAFVPLPFTLYIPFAVVALWGTLLFGSFLVLFVWDARRGFCSRRHVDWRRPTHWDGSFPDEGLTGTPERLVDKVRDTWCELRDTIRQCARGE